MRAVAHQNFFDTNNGAPEIVLYGARNVLCTTIILQDTEQAPRVDKDLIMFMELARKGSSIKDITSKNVM